MSATTGFDLANITQEVNEDKFGTLFYHAPLFLNNTFTTANQYGDIMLGAKQDHYKLPTIGSEATLKDGSDCGFTPTDETTFGQTDLYMQSVMVTGQWCIRKLEPYWLGRGLPPGQHYQERFGIVESNMLYEIERELARKMAIFPWYGPTGSDSVTYPYNWFAQLKGAVGICIASTATDNGGVNGTDATGAWNRIETIKNRFLTNPDTAAEVMDGGIVVYVSPLVASLYYENLRTLYGQNTLVPVQAQMDAGNMMSWTHPGSGIRVVVVNALGAGENEIIATRVKNQVLAFDLQADATRLEMGMDQYREYVWYKARVKMGTAWRSLAVRDICYYGAAS
jgi:hypothetical protein